MAAGLQKYKGSEGGLLSSHTPPVHKSPPKQGTVVQDKRPMAAKNHTEKEA